MFNCFIVSIVVKVGPVEDIGFAISQKELSDNYAHVVFKYVSSVQDGVKLMNGTVLYGSAIITEALLGKEKQTSSKRLKDVKQHIDKKHHNQSTNTYQNRRDNQNLVRTNGIQDEPSSSRSLLMRHVHNHNSNRDNHDCRLDIVSINHLKDTYYKCKNNDISSKKYNPGHRSKKHNSDNHVNYRGSKLNRTLDSKETSYDDRELYLEQYDGKNLNYRVPNKTNIIVTLSDTEKKITEISSGYNVPNTNYDNKKQYRVEKYKSNFNDQQTERYQNETLSSKSFSFKAFKKKSYTSERFNKSKVKYPEVQYHSVSKYKTNDYKSNLNEKFQKCNDLSQLRSHVSFKEDKNEYPNNNDRYSQRENNPENYNEYNREYSKNIEGFDRNRLGISGHSYNYNDKNYDRRMYSKSYDKYCQRGQDKSHSRKDSHQ